VEREKGWVARKKIKTIHYLSHAQPNKHNSTFNGQTKELTKETFPKEG
jgi:hypothetical protein